MGGRNNVQQQNCVLYFLVWRGFDYPAAIKSRRERVGIDPEKRFQILIWETIFRYLENYIGGVASDIQFNYKGIRDIDRAIAQKPGLKKSLWKDHPVIFISNYSSK